MRLKWTLLAGLVLLVAAVLAVIVMNGPAPKALTDLSGSDPDSAAVKEEPTPEPEPDVEEASTDIVVIGSEMEGMYLARAAKDEGLDVVVLDPREKIGGQLLQGEMLFLDETRDGSGKLLVQGRAKELFDGFRAGQIRKLSEFTDYYNNKLAKGIPIESGIQLKKIETKPGANGEETVTSILYVKADGSHHRITASYFVENTDYAAMAGQLKVNRLPGLEAFYGKNEIEYMSAGMMMKFKNVDWQKFKTHFNGLTAAERNKKYGYGNVNESYAIGLSGMTSAYQPSNDRVFLRGLNAVNQRDGEVIINAFLIYDVNPADEQSVKEAIELGKAEIPLILEHFRKNIVGWENAELNGFPDYLYIREYDHYETDYVMQVSDMLGGRMFYDNISIGGYPLDLQGISVQKWGIEMGRPDKYGMPLRSFLLKNYDNVIMAGKNVGSSAIAYGSARIQPNTALAAESIGVILGQIDGKKKLKELTESDWPQLHAYLQEKYQIKLTNIQATNKLAGWTEEEIRKLNVGEIIFPQYSRSK
ncbi:FAD-dependent oxidoreductase [Paenibacillus sp. SAFN-117]|uniref:FAD-dependent oxidoreductase n=1 Tax=Paenibacillus sp. SAFN-117 TaxID=3436860 RepID=UPI003F7EB996